MERPVFFVCGAVKSGTTWLQRLLDAHPEVTCSGEGHFVDRLLSPILAIKKAYERDLTKEAAIVYEGKPYYETLPDRAILDAARIIILELMGQRATDATKVIGDKTPGYTRSLRELRLLFPDAKFINITRDPRDATVSRLHHAYRAGMTDALTPGTEYHLQLLKHSATVWGAAQATIAAYSSVFPGCVLDLRYEALLETPLETAQSAFHFLGVDRETAVVERAVATASFEALTGRARGVEDPNAFLRKGVAGDWRATLDEEAVRIIEQGCGPWLARCGYVPATR